MRRVLVWLAGMLLLVGCAATVPPKSDFLGEYAKKLGPGAEGGAKLRWVRPGVDFTRYNRFMVDYVTFALAEDSQYKGIDGNEMKRLGDAASLALVTALQAKFPVVNEPGPDVARVRIAIVDLKQSNPALSVFTTVMPLGTGISLVRKGTTGAWTGSGATRMEGLILDSMTSEVLAAGYDEYKAGFTERYTKWGSVEEAFKYWGERGATILERLKAAKETGPAGARKPA